MEDGVRAINSCLRLVCACDGLSLTTVEGLGSSKGGFGAEQLAIADGNGSQCGFCTPGWVTAAAALRAAAKKKGTSLAPLELQRALDGNICRCTGATRQRRRGSIEDSTIGLCVTQSGCRLGVGHEDDLESFSLSGKSPM